jgi:hypothetical protein
MPSGSFSPTGRTPQERSREPSQPSAVAVRVAGHSWARAVPREIERDAVLGGFDGDAQPLQRLDDLDAQWADRRVAAIRQRT